MFGYSRNGHEFDEDFDTPEEAANAGIDEEGGSCIVGEWRAASSPESFIDAEDILEKVACQDDYMGDWADDWPESTKEQEQELTDALRATFAAWLDKHSLRPEFRLVDGDTMRTYSLIDGECKDIGPHPLPEEPQP